MVQSHRRGHAEKVYVPPLKKVTFYGPVMTTKADKLRHVGVKHIPSKKTLFSSISSSSKANPSMPDSKNNKDRPHSKMSVIGNQIKTRLNCNHMKPICEACVLKKKTTMPRHKTLNNLTPRLSHILSSTRNHPRGGTDGRKLYDREDGIKAVSHLNADWKPGQDPQYEKQELRSGSAGNNESISGNYEKDRLATRQHSEEGIRKKVQFVDGDDGRLLDRGRSLGNNFVSQSSSEKSKVTPNQKGRVKSRNYQNNHNQRRIYPDSTSSDFDNIKIAADSDICSVCKSLGYVCFEHSKYRSKYSGQRERQYQGRKRAQSMPEPSSSSDDVCLLCRRYGKNHYYVVEDDYCRLCDEIPLRLRYGNHDPIVSNASQNPRLAYHRRMTRPLHRRWSAPMFYSDGEDDGILQRNIPYEPKTEYVKDLKKKLEDEYKHREYLRKKSHRPWRSWDAEDLEELRSYRLRKTENPWMYIPQHKCVHHYIQNDRLFLEPTVTDEDGSSLCSECGAPKPENPLKDPYLYHITLGSLRNRERIGKENRERNFRDLLPLTKNRNSNIILPKSSSKLPGDSSKHIYTKLNRNIGNIFPRSSHYQPRPYMTSELRYNIDPHVKRHPSKSMALIDHLV
ncbi:hypothetical protein SK128_009059 [Halocaridina rubra]|uniref:Uncharacterized protein n=1 Tax=Halocaridina rubra TaxID=373956 RepID=A0AAN8X8C0_HALRR